MKYVTKLTTFVRKLFPAEMVVRAFRRDDKPVC
jgi:hypothetical protein